MSELGERLFRAVLGTWEGTSEPVAPGDARAGGAFLGERLELLAAVVASAGPGDLLEVGAGRGYTSQGLARVARRFGRRLVCVDPWPLSEERQTFLEQLRGYEGLLEAVQARSDSPQVARRLAGRRLCFAFLDGEHSYTAVHAELGLVLPAALEGLVCCDDYSWNTEVARAVQERAPERQVLVHPQRREAYLLPF